MAGKGIDQDIAGSLPRLGAVRQTHGDHDGAGLRVGIAASRFNGHLTGPLVASVVDALRACGVGEADICVHWVPGAFELPTGLAGLVAAESPDVCVAAGVVLEGATTHARMITRGVNQGMLDLSRRAGLPVIDAVVAVETPALAEERCLSGRDSRGWYAGMAAVEMATLARARAAR